MGTRDPRVDAYIDKSAEFAKPILAHLRELVHASVPDVEETIKWSMPFFLYKGGMFANMAAFKAHAAFGFWKGDRVVGEASRNAEAMGQLGRITSVKELPPKKVFAAWLKTAMTLRDAPPHVAAKKTAAKKAPKPPIASPAWFTTALRKHAKARAGFEAFSPSQRREYLEWLTEAKSDATREKRLATALEWMAEGKGRNWKYEKKG